MAAALQGGTRDPSLAGQNVGLTTYLPLMLGFNTITGAFATEANGQTTCRTAGSLSKLEVLVVTNSLSSAATTFSSRKNSAGGAMSISVTHGVTGIWSDLTNSDALVATNTYGSAFVTEAGGSGSILVTSIVANLSATTNHAAVYGADEGRVAPTAGSTTFFHMPCGGMSNFTTTESEVQLKLRAAGTLKNLQVNSSIFSRSSVTFKSRVGGANGNQTLSVTSTGLFEDTTHTDTVSSTNLINFSMATDAGSGSHTYTFASMLFINTTGSLNNVFMGCNQSGTKNYARAASATASFVPILGALTVDNTTEGSSKIQHNFTVANSFMTVNVTASTYSVAGTVTSRKNGSAGSQTISLTALTTGLFEDTTNSDTLATTDDFCFSVAGGTSGSATMMWFGSLDTATAAALFIRNLNLLQAVNRASTY